MKPSKEIVPPLIMVICGAIVLIICFNYLDNYKPPKVFENLKGIILIIVALATAAVSIALPGLIKLGKDPETGLQKTVSPEVAASGALAVFIIVYLFIPVTLYI